jgi:hypothetical protein
MRPVCAMGLMSDVRVCHFFSNAAFCIWNAKGQAVYSLQQHWSDEIQACRQDAAEDRADSYICRCAKRQKEVIDASEYSISDSISEYCSQTKVEVDVRDEPRAFFNISKNKANKANESTSEYSSDFKIFLCQNVWKLLEHAIKPYFNFCHSVARL